MNRFQLVLITLFLVLFSSACVPALPSVGYNDPASEADLVGTWKLKKASGMKFLGIGTLTYTFEDDCGGYTCDIETTTGTTFEYEFDEGASTLFLSNQYFLWDY